MDGLIARTEGKGLRYEAALAARLEGGKSETAPLIYESLTSSHVRTIL